MALSPSLHSFQLRHRPCLKPSHHTSSPAPFSLTFQWLPPPMAKLLVPRTSVTPQGIFSFVRTVFFVLHNKWWLSFSLSDTHPAPPKNGLFSALHPPEPFVPLDLLQGLLSTEHRRLSITSDPVPAVPELTVNKVPENVHSMNNRTNQPSGKNTSTALGTEV